MQSVSSRSCLYLQLASQSAEAEAEARQSSSKEELQGLVLPVNRPTYIRSKVADDIFVVLSSL